MGKVFSFSEKQQIPSGWFFCFLGLGLKIAPGNSNLSLAFSSSSQYWFLKKSATQIKKINILLKAQCSGADILLTAFSTLEN